MSASAPSPATRADQTARPPAWWLGAAAGGWVLAMVTSAVVASVVLAVTGYTDAEIEEIPLSIQAVAQAGLWSGMLGAPLLVIARSRAAGTPTDLGLRARLLDGPIGAGVGLLSQYLLVPLVSIPWLIAIRERLDELDDEARELTDRATDGLSIALLVVIVVIGAPIVEELFFRGLLQRSLLRWMGPAPAIALQAVVFALTHFQKLQFAALFAFGALLGYLAHRTGRLGPGIAAHMVFNGAAVFNLVVLQ
jgi:membrane protease YdiL (CAAX protease family)